MEDLELKCFEIIASVGTARSMYIDAIAKAKNYQFDEARNIIKEGEKLFVKGHGAHSDLLQNEANGEKLVPNLLLLHAEDQLMSAESFKIIADEFIKSYEKIEYLENKIANN